MRSLHVFIALQLGDLFTTLVFLSLGINEANPIAVWLMSVMNPVLALILIKAVAIIAAYGIRAFGVSLRFINLFFLAVVAWNIAAILRTLIT